MSKFHEYEQCAHCSHFIEPTDPMDTEYGAAAYLHLDDGEKDHDHDATRSGMVRTLDEWRAFSPGLFLTYPDGRIGPNSRFWS